MTDRYLLCFFCAIITLFTSCSRNDLARSDVNLLDPSIVSGDRAMDEVANFVALGPRDSGTDGCERAAAYLAKRLKDCGLTPETDEFIANSPKGDTTFRNVTATVSGESDEIVLLVSHYDTKSGISSEFAGANDSGSSTGLLLELMRSIQGVESRPLTVMAAFVDGEECMVSYGPNDGLQGSSRLASQLSKSGMAKKVKAVIVMDMIGDGDLSVTIPRNSTRKLVSMAFRAASEEGIRKEFILLDRTVGDDHVPFLRKGMKAVDLIDFQYGSKPGLNDYWHSEEDTMDKLSSESLHHVGRVVIRMLNMLGAE